MVNTQTINLNKVELSKANPRIVDIDIDVTGDWFRDKQAAEINENELVKEILSYEGSFSDMLALISSLSEKYDTKIAKPYLIKYGDKFIAVEGNRRIMCMKALAGMIDFPLLSTIKINADDPNRSEIDEDGYEINSEEVRSESTVKNYDSMLKVIDEYRKRNKDKIKLEFDMNVISNENPVEEAEEIRVCVFSNHVTGRVVGKRNWNRGRTLLMYLSFLKDGEDTEDTIKKICKLLYRDKANVHSNIKSAFFIKDVLTIAGENVVEYLKTHQVSSLETQFVKSFFNVVEKNRYETYVKLDTNKKFDMSKYPIKNKSAKNVCDFIVLAHKTRKLTTRINEATVEDWPPYNGFFLNAEDVTTTEKITMQSSLSGIMSYTGTNPEIIKVKNSLSKVREIANKTEDVVNKINLKFSEVKFINWKNALIKLIEQLNLLYKNSRIISDIYINGICTSTRTFAELFSGCLLIDKSYISDMKSHDNVKGIIYQIFSKDPHKKLLLSLATDKEKDDYKNNFISKNIELDFLNGEIDDAQKIFTAMRTFFSDKCFSSVSDKYSYYKKLNSILDKNYNLPDLDNDVWDWIFDPTKYTFESNAVHRPQMYEVEANFNSKINDLKDNYEMTNNLFNVLLK